MYLNVHHKTAVSDVIEDTAGSYDGLFRASENAIFYVSDILLGQMGSCVARTKPRTYKHVRLLCNIA